LRNTCVAGSLTASSFAPKVDIVTGSGCFSVSAGDLDGDGMPDLVAANSGNGTVSVIRNISTPGNIAFAAAANLVVETGISGGGPHQVSIGDLDGDGKPDLAVVMEMNSLLSIIRNMSTVGSFTNSSLAGPLNLATGSNPWGVSVGDLDGDGRPDIVFANYYSATISIYQNEVPFAVAPTIATQPTNQTVGVGSPATFTVAAGGTPPLSYQWSFDGAAISGATNTSFTVASVQLTNAGTYSVVVGNSVGSTASSNAVLSFASTLQVASVSAPGCGLVTVPVNLLATGDESALEFSLDFDTNILTFAGLTMGSGASGALMFTNTIGAVGGRIGVNVAFFEGSFSAGTQEVVEVTFQAAMLTNTVATPVSFGTTPDPCKISDAWANPIAGVFLAGTVTVPPTPLEGDVWPVTNEDYQITVNDWVQEGRFVAGLDTITNASEFQRADCAPRATSGDGQITIIDWIQVGRYAAGLDPLTAEGSAAGSPAIKTPAIKMAASPSGRIAPLSGSLQRTLSFLPLTQGATASSVMVEFQAQGDESGLSFSVSFNPAEIRYVTNGLGSGASGAMLIVNTNSVAAGQLGLALALPNVATFAAGKQPIVKLYFNSVSYSNTVPLAFSDSPIWRQVGDASANPVSATYLNGSLVIGGAPWPQLAISQFGANIVLSWPSSPGGLSAQMATNLNGSWTSVGGTPITNGSTNFLTLPAPSTVTYFQLNGP
jgi:hypothetical protein